MVEFEHQINASEVNTSYLNLTDDFGNKYGDQIGPHKTTLTVIDGDGRRTQMKRHYGNQLTQCADWFSNNNLREGLDPADGFALLTSRCSFELVQKAVLARIPLLATISAPTELGVKIAEESKLTLVALARRDSVLLFNDPYKSLIKVL